MKLLATKTIPNLVTKDKLYNITKVNGKYYEFIGDKGQIISTDLTNGLMVFAAGTSDQFNYDPTYINTFKNTIDYINDSNETIANPEIKRLVCECGAHKANTTHANWCDIKNY